MQYQHEEARLSAEYRQQRGGRLQVDDLVDVIEGNRIYIPCLYILNKIDQITLEELEVIDRMENYVPICAYHEWNLDGVLECVWDKLNLTRCAICHKHGPRFTLTRFACLYFAGQGGNVVPCASAAYM